MIIEERMVFTMVINCKDSLNRYEGMVKAIANAYEEHLNNNALFSLKLDSLSVYLEKSKNSLTSGLTHRFGKNSHIQVWINEDNGDEYIAFIVAHEFAHLLFQKLTDCLYLTGIATDGSADFTAIVRMDENGDFYGKELEEQCADILALYIIKKLGYKLSSTLVNDLEKTEAERITVERLIDVFGEDINKYDQIDYYKIENNFGFVANSFWYHVITFSFAEIVKLYDEVMGRGSFQNFCKNLDHYKEKNTNLKQIEVDLEKLRKVGKVA